jgi:hypothetical protein
MREKRKYRSPSLTSKIVHLNNYGTRIATTGTSFDVLHITLQYSGQRAFRGLLPVDEAIQYHEYMRRRRCRITPGTASMSSHVAFQSNPAHSRRLYRAGRLRHTMRVYDGRR